MNDVNHCITKALVESNPTGTMFVLEDLAKIKSVQKGNRVPQYGRSGVNFVTSGVVNHR